jgi:hypothetical protein
MHTQHKEGEHEASAAIFPEDVAQKARKSRAT